MTAEISLLNRHAVALAADSAVTIQRGERVKVRPTANKIFSLSKYNPVGVMIYDEAQLVGVPWETIVKAFRQELSREAYPSLDGYVERFLQFVQTSGIVGAEFQAAWYVSSVRYYFEMLRQQLVSRLQEREDAGKNITGTIVQRSFASIAQEHAKHWRSARYLDTESGPGLQRRVRVQFRSEILKSIKDVFEKLPMSDRTRGYLVQIASCIPSKWPSWPRPPQSGVVIAGFGTDSTFPSLRSYRISGMLLDRLKITEDVDDRVDVGLDAGAAIIPFAQRDWVDVFLSGLHPLHRVTFLQLVKDLVLGVSSSVIDQISELARPEKLREKRRLTSKKVAAVVKESLEALDQHTRREFIDPVLETLSSVSKEELASIAEALVGLTSFRQQVTMETETVGGPIDVAVISKGDGFIWIKRKHYFDRELNPHFFATYYKEVRSGRKEADEET